jgi:hypothetical protein
MKRTGKMSDYPEPATKRRNGQLTWKMFFWFDVAPGDHVLDHNHMFLFGSDPQTVHVKAGETVYFQYVEAMSLVFEVADNQAQAARTVSKMRTVQEALAHSRHQSDL